MLKSPAAMRLNLDRALYRLGLIVGVIVRRGAEGVIRR
jgi:hypothetical protein